MMNVTTAFLRGSQYKAGRRQDRFTPLTKIPKEILAMETVKFKAPPLMTGPVENRNKNKFCEFHGDKGHGTNECIHLRRQIEEAVRSGELSHLVKEIKQGGKRGEHAKTTKKGEAPNKEKATAIFMVQPWQRITRQKTTQSFFTGRGILFSCPSKAAEDKENPIVIGSGSRWASYPPLVRRRTLGLRSAIRALSQQTSPRNKKPNDSSYNPSPRV
ncbi:hypothetical protein Tco_1146088 [Tanacetum coccineum]